MKQSDFCALKPANDNPVRERAIGDLFEEVIEARRAGDRRLAPVLRQFEHQTGGFDRG